MLLRGLDSQEGVWKGSERVSGKNNGWRELQRTPMRYTDALGNGAVPGPNCVCPNGRQTNKTSNDTVQVEETIFIVLDKYKTKIEHSGINEARKKWQTNRDG